MNKINKMGWIEIITFKWEQFYYIRIGWTLKQLKYICNNLKENSNEFFFFLNLFLQMVLQNVV